MFIPPLPPAIVLLALALLLTARSSSVAQTTQVYTINPTVIDGPGGGGVFFEQSGTFEVPALCGVQASLHGGPTPGSEIEVCWLECLSCDTLPCVGN